MDKKTILRLLQEVKSGDKRKFTQSYDLIINLKNIDLKKLDQPLDWSISLHSLLGRRKRICAFVGPEMMVSAKEACDLAISVDSFNEYTDKKKVKKLANEYDFFIAQATIMPKVAAQFGKVFGPRAKMPNPKLGCVVPPTANLRNLCENLQKTMIIKAKAQPMFQVMVGNEAMGDEEVVDNILTVYNSVLTHLPSEKNNIRSIYLKLTMGKPVRMDTPSDDKVEKTKARKKKVITEKEPEKKDEPAE